MVPNLDSKFCCVVNYKEYILGALVSSYIHSGKYTPFFEFSEVSTEQDLIDSNFIDEHQISRSRSRIFNIRVNNCISRMRECETIILIGLSAEQKSYLNFPQHISVIEINDQQDVENYLLGFAGEKEKIKCSTEKILESLYYALQNNLRLELDDYATTTIENLDQDKENGLIVIEHHNDTSTIVAINYASSINASIKIINPPKIEESEVNYYIEKWKLQNDRESIDELRRIIISGIDEIDLDFSFITFFTIGIPYSLIFENVVPMSHIHLYLHPDFFVFNNIYFEENEKIFSSLIFSPKKFSNEETQNVIKRLEDAYYLVFDLLDDNATTTNIDLAVQSLPYSLLHFCSHGGPMKGARIKKYFTDRDGNKHIVEYDQLLSIMPDRSKPLVKVMLKYLPRKFDNLIWKSKELKALNHPHHVFSDMMNSITSKDQKFISKKVIKNIPNSCAIECKTFHYQAMFNTFCDNHSPVIFNNTCWSNSDIKSHFIGNGAKSYIGTLWNINNSTARNSANIFYDKIFENNILENFHVMQNLIEEDSDNNVYIFWGLHFSTLSSGKNLEQSKVQIIDRLKKAVFNWHRNYSESTNPDTKISIRDFINFLNKYFFKIVMKS